MLFIYRLDKWDLPKGKIETGETAETAALREVTEETGLGQLQLMGKIGETYHTYNAYGKHYLKTTHWFYMSCSSKQLLIPQTEENIADIKWIKTKNVDLPLQHTYPSIKDILGLFFNKP